MFRPPTLYDPGFLCHLVLLSCKFPLQKYFFAQNVLAKDASSGKKMNFIYKVSSLCATGRPAPGSPAWPGGVRTPETRKHNTKRNHKKNDPQITTAIYSIRKLSFKSPKTPDSEFKIVTKTNEPHQKQALKFQESKSSEILNLGLLS